MTTKNIIYGVLIVIIIAIAGLWIWNNQTEKVNCLNIVSSKNIEKCIGKEIKAIGIFRQIPSGMKGVGNLIFDDGTSIQFIEATNLKAEYNDKKIEVQGKIYKCGDLDQCAGIGINDIESITLVSGKEQKFSKNVIDLCKKESDSFKNCRIQTGCVDGFTEYCYFDSTKYKKDELKTEFPFPDETKKACFAIHSLSDCQCFNKFQLKINNEFQEVTCEEFYQAIEDKNKSCGDCVDEISAGCC
jgi:hypothetical protein